MKYIRLFGSAQERDAALANVDYNVLQKTVGVGLGIVRAGVVPPTPVGPAPNEIWYTTTDNETAEFYDITDMNDNENSLVSNIYTNGKGIATYTNSITSIKKYFADGTNISSIILPEGLLNVGYEPFNDFTINPLEITIPSTLSSMFVLDYIVEFTLVINSPTMIPLDYMLFGETARAYDEGNESWAPWHYYQPFYIYVPANLVNMYKTDEYWSQYDYAIFPIQ